MQKLGLVAEMIFTELFSKLTLSQDHFLKIVYIK